MAVARALSFDMDGTLYRVHRLRTVWRLRWERGLLLALMAAREKIRHEPPLADEQALRRREAELVAPSFGLPIEACEARLEALREEMPAAMTKGFAPHRGVKSALLAAHARGLKLAVLSDYPPEEKLAHLGLEDVPWSVTCAADRSGALKPHAKAFHEVARRLGVEPAELVHVGDREDLDVRGALAAGCRAWRYAPREVSSVAERVFSAWGVALFVPLTEER